MAVFHAEAAGDGAEGLKAKALVQVPRVRVAGDDGVELQNPEAMCPALFEAVRNQLFTDVQTARCALDSVAGVADMAAAADVIGVQDIKAVYMAGLPVFCDGSMGLLREKGRTGFCVQQLLLREGHAVLYDLVPDTVQSRKVGLRICSDLDIHRYLHFLPVRPAF